MAYVGKEANIKMLKEKLKKARARFVSARKKIEDNGFQIEDIQEYNRLSNDVGCLEMKLKKETGYKKYEQFMEEHKIPHYIHL